MLEFFLGKVAYLKKVSEIFPGIFQSSCFSFFNLVKHCEILCSETFTQSIFEGALNLKVELEKLKLQIIAEIEGLKFGETSLFNDYFLKYFVNKNSSNRSTDSELHHQQILLLQKELTNKDNITQCLLTKFVKQTDFIQKQHYELQREVLIDKNNIQYQNIHQSDTKETNRDEHAERKAFTDGLILRSESVTERAQADHTTNMKVKDDHLSDKKNNNSSISVVSEKNNIVTIGDRMIKHVNRYEMFKKFENGKV